MLNKAVKVSYRGHFTWKMPHISESDCRGVTSALSSERHTNSEDSHGENFNIAG